MSRYSDALRRAVYAIGYSPSAIAREAKCDRMTLYDAIHGRVRLRKQPAHALTTAAVNMIDKQIADSENKIAELREIRIELCGSYNMEFGGGANGGNNDGVEKP